MIQDLPEVSPFSGQGNARPLSGPLQTGIRFLRHPLPPRPPAALTGVLPLPCGNGGAYHVPPGSWLLIGLCNLIFVNKTLYGIASMHRYLDIRNL